MRLLRIVMALAAFAAAATVGMSATAATGGSISGTVTNAAGEPLEGMCAEVWRTVGGEVDQWLTDASGHYTATGLADGDYKLVFRICGDPDYLEEWYDDQPDFEHATVLTIANGAQLSGIDAVLALGGSISGHLTDLEGTPLFNECANAGIAGVSSDAQGFYQIRGLSPGDYTVSFGCGIDHLMEWYDDQRSPFTAQPVTVTSGNDTGDINAALTPAGHLRGTVTDLAGSPLLGICIRAYGSNDYWEFGTAEDGTYNVDGLPGDTYRVSFAECGNSPYVTEWYNDKPDRDSADPVEVTGGNVTSGIDAALAPTAPTTGSIVGRVTDASGKGLPGICVSVRDATADGEVASATTDTAGDYAVAALTPGSYKVFLRDCVGAEEAVPEWYHDRASFDTADPVSVAAGNATRVDESLRTCSATRDADHDGLSECREIALGTDASDPDSDGDLFGDGIEVDGGRCFGVRLDGGSDPNDARSTPIGVSPFPGRRGVTDLPPICR